MNRTDLTTIIEKISFIGDVLLHWKEDNDFATFLDSNLGILGHFIWDIRDELQSVHDKPVKTEGNNVATIKPASIFEDNRFWEFVAQIKIDKHDPADILEAWLKEHKPDYFEN